MTLDLTNEEEKSEKELVQILMVCFSVGFVSLINLTWMAMVSYLYSHYLLRGHRGRDHMVVGFITTYAMSAYHH